MLKRCSTNGLRGSTLLETVIALFIIAGGLGILAALYVSTMNLQGRDIVAANLVTLAKNRTAELRTLATSSSGFDGLASQNGTVNPSDFPGYQVVTLVEDLERPYPCPGLETLPFTQSYKRVTVTGRYGTDLSYDQVSLIGAPPREVTSLVVTKISGGDPLARDQQADFRAQLLDGSGNAIPDLQFTFYVDFGTGNGQLVEDADGITVHFFNHILNLTGSNIYTGGEVRIVGRTFYAGEEYRGVSAALTLSP